MVKLFYCFTPRIYGCEISIDSPEHGGARRRVKYYSTRWASDVHYYLFGTEHLFGTQANQPPTALRIDF
jgi:hypothetical protein